MKPDIIHFYKKDSVGSNQWTEPYYERGEKRVSFGEQVRNVLYNLVAHPDLPKFMFGKKGEWLRTVGVLGTLFLVGGLVAGYMAMQDKELVILKANVNDLNPVIGEPGQLRGLEVNNEAGIGLGIYPRGEVDWDSRELVAGTDCLIRPGKPLTPPSGVAWAVPRREPDQGYKADRAIVNTLMNGMLTIITVNYQEVSPDSCIGK